MPNIEIHGLVLVSALKMKERIFATFSDEPYINELVVTIFQTIVRNKNNNTQPFLRLTNSCQKHTKEIIERLKQFGMDIEHLKLKAFYPRIVCGCEGSCPACRVGEVNGHKCNRCGAEFCPICHGIANDVKSENVSPCSCGSS